MQSCTLVPVPTRLLAAACKPACGHRMPDTRRTAARLGFYFCPGFREKASRRTVQRSCLLLCHSRSSSRFPATSRSKSPPTRHRLRKAEGQEPEATGAWVQPV